LVILGYPCNQFGKQEPYATAEELFNGIRHVRPGGGFEPKLDYMFEKVDVNGENEIPIYTFLKNACGPTFTQFSRSTSLFYEPLRLGDIAWNFEKFLIDRDGRPHTRWHPRVTNALDMAEDVETVMNRPSQFDGVSRMDPLEAAFEEVAQLRLGAVDPIMQEREQRSLDWQIHETA